MCVCVCMLRVSVLCTLSVSVCVPVVNTAVLRVAAWCTCACAGMCYISDLRRNHRVVKPVARTISCPPLQKKMGIPAQDRSRVSPPWLAQDRGSHPTNARTGSLHINMAVWEVDN